MFRLRRITPWVIVFPVILKTIAVESRFHKTPSNTAAVVGQLMKMECWTNPDETTQWFFSQHVDITSSIVYNGETVSPEFASRFYVDNYKWNGQHDLTAKRVQMTDAGTYECAVLSRETPDRSIPVLTTAQLIVLESEPRCSTNVSAKYGYVKEFDYLAFRCAVNYSGYWTPSMQWSTGGRALDGSTYVINSNVSQGVEHLSSAITLQVGAELDGFLVSCKTWFSETSMKVHHTNAANVPDYVFNWNTTLNIHFTVRNVTITPRRDKYEQEDVLNCTAIGNPSPSYSWRNVRTQEEIATGPRLALNTTRMDSNQRYIIECVAQNRVAGDIEMSSATVEVILSGPWRLPFGYIIAAGVSIVGTLLAVFIIKRIRNKISSEKFGSKVYVAQENVNGLSPDYDSIPVAEVNESPSTPTIPDRVALTEDASEGYSALMERLVIVQQPVVYNSLEAVCSDVTPEMVSEGSPVYANITIE